jgi:hypothetical protein
MEQQLAAMVGGARARGALLPLHPHGDDGGLLATGTAAHASADGPQYAFMHGGPSSLSSAAPAQHHIPAGVHSGDLWDGSARLSLSMSTLQPSVSLAGEAILAHADGSWAGASHASAVGGGSGGSGDGFPRGGDVGLGLGAVLSPPAAGLVSSLASMHLNRSSAARLPDDLGSPSNDGDDDGDGDGDDLAYLLGSGVLSGGGGGGSRASGVKASPLSVAGRQGSTASLTGRGPVSGLSHASHASHASQASHASRASKGSRASGASLHEPSAASSAASSAAGGLAARHGGIMVPLSSSTPAGTPPGTAGSAGPRSNTRAKAVNLTAVMGSLSTRLVDGAWGWVGRVGGAGGWGFFGVGFPGHAGPSHPVPPPPPLQFHAAPACGLLWSRCVCAVYVCACVWLCVPCMYACVWLCVCRGCVRVCGCVLVLEGCAFPPSGGTVRAPAPLPCVSCSSWASSCPLAPFHPLCLPNPHAHAQTQVTKACPWRS